MSANLQIESKDHRHSGGVVWNRLHSEREEFCEASLRATRTSDQTRTDQVESVSTDKLQERLRLIDDAQDRLMTGGYGDCIICGRWIEDTTLDADPALPFWFACARRSGRNSH
jgi:RNA polymerase-binding transcription factor DksA